MARSFWGILLITPFFVLPDIHNFMTLGKISLLKILGAILLIMVTLAPKIRRVEWRPGPFFYPLICLLFFILGSVFFGHDLWVAYFGGFERTFGFTGYFLFIAIFIFLQNQELSKDEFFILLKIIYFLGFGMAFYTVLQVIGLDFLPFIPKLRAGPITWAIFSGNALPGGFTGNSGYLSTYLTFSLPLGLPLFFRESKKTKKIIIASMAMTILLALFLARTRSVWFSLAASGLVFMIFFYKGKFKTAKNKKYFYLFLPFCLFIILFYLFNQFGLNFFTEGFLNSLKARFYLITPSLQLILKYPIFGIGSENYRAAMMPFSPMELAANTKVFFDNPHNNFLSLWVQFGIGALIAHLWILWRWIKIAKAAYTSEQKEWQLVGASLILIGFSYFFWQWSWFDTSVTISMFFCSLVLLTNLERFLKKIDRFEFEKKLPEFKTLHLQVSLLVILVVIPTIYMTVNMIRANNVFFGLYASLGASAAGENVDTQKLIEKLKETHEIYPYESRYLVELSRSYARNYIKTKNPYDLELALETSRQSEKHAWEPDKIFNLEMRILLEQKKITEALEAGEQSIFYSPHNIELRLRLAQFYLQRAEGEKALPHLLHVLKLNEKEINSLQMLSYYYIAKKDKTNALFYAQKIIAYYPNQTESAAQDLLKKISDIR